MELWSLISVVFVITISVVCGQWRDRFYPCFQANLDVGVCVPYNLCPHIRNNNWEEEISFCGFYSRYPRVCCPKHKSKTTSQHKCKQKCAEYHNINEIGKGDEDVTNHLQESEDSLAREFPHMAALGFGNQNDVQWRCGGSLISERFILTAAHCLFSQQLGEVKFVRLGDLNILNNSDNQNVQQFEVVERISHPQYSPPSQYNDIALLRLDKDVKFTDFVKPICLQSSKDLTDTIPVATGWGSVEYGGELSADLKKVELQYFSNEKCRQTYGPERRLEFGVLDDIHICAGGINDTCQGDSGGPLQVRVSSHPIVYNIIGITSFGKACGVANIPGVYTRVSSYVEWIELIVWPI